MSNVISNNKLWTQIIEAFNGLYKRNKMLLTVAVAIFFVSIFSGILIGYFSSGFIKNLLLQFVQMLRAQVELNTISIFIKNLQALLFTYAGGIIGIIPAVTLSFNGFFYGAFIGYFMHGGVVSNYGVFNAGDFIIYTLPHGIFEIPGFILSGAAGFRLATMVVGIITNIMREEPVNEHYWKFKDSLALLAIAIVLIFVAAIIEANYSISIGNQITGLHLH